MAAYDVCKILDKLNPRRKSWKFLWCSFPHLVLQHACLRRARHPFWQPWHWLTSSCIGWISLHWPWQSASTCFVFPINLVNKNRAWLEGQEHWKKKQWSNPERGVHVRWFVFCLACWKVQKKSMMIRMGRERGERRSIREGGKTAGTPTVVGRKRRWREWTRYGLWGERWTEKS